MPASGISEVSTDSGTTAGATTADIKANGSDGPITVTSGTSVSISWSSQNAVACGIAPSAPSQWAGNFGLSNNGKDSGPLTQSITYTLQCSPGTNGVITGNPISDSVTINVAANNPNPTVTFQSIAGSNVAFSFTSLPANSQIVFINQTSGQRFTGTSYIGSGTGTASMPITSTMPAGTYYLKAQDYTTQAYIAQSVSFTVAGNTPTPTAPHITSISPASYSDTQTNATITITGTGFVTDDIRVDDTFVSARTSADGTTLSFTTGGLNSVMRTAGTHTMIVRDIATGLSSNSATLTITPGNATQTTRDNDRKTNLRALASALEAYKIVSGSYPVTGWVISSGGSNWLPGLASAALPHDPEEGTVCPWDPAETYGYAYVSRDGTNYKIIACADIQVPPSDPMYDLQRPGMVFALCGGTLPSGTTCGTLASAQPSSSLSQMASVLSAIQAILQKMRGQ